MPANEDYDSLQTILNEALARASHGKGAERHSNGLPFMEQWIVQGGIRYGVGALLFQAVKKLNEHERLDPEAGDRELLDVINYLAAAILVRRNKRPALPKLDFSKMTVQQVDMGRTIR